MPFHNHVAKLVHWFFWCFSRSTNLGSRTHFCRVSQHSLEFDYPLPFKEYSTVLYSTAHGKWPLQGKKAPLCSALNPGPFAENYDGGETGRKTKRGEENTRHLLNLQDLSFWVLWMVLMFFCIINHYLCHVCTSIRITTVMFLLVFVLYIYISQYVGFRTIFWQRWSYCACYFSISLRILQFCT